MSGAIPPLGAGRGGLPMLSLHARDGGRADVYLHGAHVTSWITPDGAERLYLSEHAVFDGRTPIRGGIPVVFPQFAEQGPLRKHGFVRTQPWTLVDAAPEGATPYATLELRDTPATRAEWDHAFLLQLRVELVVGSLRIALAVHNPGERAFEFTAALHTYLRVDDIRDVRVQGLRGVRFRDAAAGGAESVSEAATLEVHEGLDRIHNDVPGAVDVRELERLTRVSATGFPDVVVWNPGPGGERGFRDLPAGDAARLLCVEAAVIERPPRVEPGDTWTGTQRLRAAEPTSALP